MRMNQLIILLKFCQKLENKKITNKFNLLSSFSIPGKLSLFLVDGGMQSLISMTQLLLLKMS